MKKIIIAILVAMCALEASATVYVRGYTRSNGTYVAPHTRTNPDGVTWNNKSNGGW